MPVMIAAVLTMSAAQLLDLATFMAMVRAVGPEAEANPLVALLYGAYGFPLVAIVKIVLLAVTAGVAAILTPVAVRPRLAGAVVAAGIVVGLVGGLSNSITLGAIAGAVQRAGLGGP